MCSFKVDPNFSHTLQIKRFDMNLAASEIPFLRDPDKISWDRICFNERLAVHGIARAPAGSAPLGFQLISVEQTETDNSPTLTVTVHRDYQLEHTQVLTDIHATLDPDLQTVNQHWKQTVNYPERQRWSHLHLVRERHQYMVQVRQGASGQEPVTRQYRLNREKMRFLYTEGALAVLARLIAVLDYQPAVHGTAMEITGRIYPFAQQNHGWLPLSPETGATRCVRLSKGLSRGGDASESFIHLTSDGRVVAQAVHAWPVRAEALYLSPGRPPVDWELDQQLVSVFLDRRMELRALFERYLREHPEVRQLLSAFMQSVLLWKPSDVFQFAEEFFTPFSVTYKSEEQKQQEDALHAALATVHGDWEKHLTEPKVYTD